jgi:predicted nucleic acid-binding protein
VQVLVSDTSVLIDIERASLTARLFDLPYDFVVPDILYEAELLDWMGPDLIDLGLRVEELTPEETARATELKRAKAMLSTPDVFAFCLAVERNWVLLTGDGALRAEAESQKLSMHGVLWVFDEMEKHMVCATSALKAGLEAVRDHPRCRLPQKEINRRLARY